MKRIRLALFLVLASYSFALYAGDLEKQIRSATSAMHLINELGAKEALARLASDPKAWDAVVRGVSSGSAEWLRVAAALRPASDSGASEDLDDAMIDALPNNPAGVLRFIKARPSDPHFGVGSACTASPRADSKAQALSHLARAERAVSAVSASDLMNVRNKCLASLRQARRELKAEPNGR